MLGESQEEGENREKEMSQGTGKMLREVRKTKSFRKDSEDRVMKYRGQQNFIGKKEFGSNLPTRVEFLRPSHAMFNYL